MRQLEIEITNGITATPITEGARLHLKAMTGEELYCDLPRVVTETLRDQLNEILDRAEG